MKLMPHDLALCVSITSVRERVVEVISRETPDKTIMVRMVPGEPTTMVEMPVSMLRLRPRGKVRYLHVASVRSSLPFPEDMLRYDNAALFDHTVQEEPLRSDGEVIVYTVSDSKAPPWTNARWMSFGAGIIVKYVRDLRHPEAAIVKDVSPKGPIHPSCY